MKSIFVMQRPYGSWRIGDVQEGRKKKKDISRRRKFFGRVKRKEQNRVLSRSYPDMISYLKLPTPLFPVPYCLFPVPYSLFPIAYSLFPIPYSLSIMQLHQLEKSSWTKEEFESVLYSQKNRYHHLHPFHKRMNEGLLTPTEIRNWVANRFYYQKNIPLKDAGILANCPHREVRREWIERIIDHDGRSDAEGGIEAWLQLGQAVGLSRSELLDERHVLPSVRYAVDAYVNFCRHSSWIIAIAASLTELFGPDAIKVRLAALESHYSWIEPWGFEYFRVRLQKAPRDAKYALNLVLQHCQTRSSQEQAVKALEFKCDLLWSQLDAIDRGDTRPCLDDK